MVRQAPEFLEFPKDAATPRDGTSFRKADSSVGQMDPLELGVDSCSERAPIAMLRAEESRPVLAYRLIWRDG